MVAHDTSPEAAAVQLEAYRRMGPIGRLKVAFELSDFGRRLAEAGIRQRHPEYAPEQVTEALTYLLYGQRPDRRED